MCNDDLILHTHAHIHHQVSCQNYGTLTSRNVPNWCRAVTCIADQNHFAFCFCNNHIHTELLKATYIHTELLNVWEKYKYYINYYGD